MISTVISDFGGVLTTPLEEAFAGFVNDTGVSLGDLGTALMTIGAELGANPIFELEVGRLTEAEFVRRLSDALAAASGRRVELDTFGTVFFRHLHTNEPMFALMAELRARGFRMGLCTNNVQEWQPLWRTPEIDALFPVIVDSGFVGVRKPDAEIYLMTLEQLGATAAETLFVDDMEINCDAARQLGMHALQFTDNDATAAAIRVALDLAVEA
jgi:putative hydrolase of the HAD superfamily